MASLATNLSNLITAIGTKFKTTISDYNAKIGDLTTLTTTAKGSAVAAINEIKSGLGASGAPINDATPASTTTTYSASKIESTAATKASAAAAALIADASATTATGTTYSAQKINAAIAAAATQVKSDLVNGAPTALDTFAELAAQMSTDESAAAALTTAVGNRLRFDAAQTLTAPQMVQGNTNLGSASLVQIGDPAVDLAALFATAIA